MGVGAGISEGNLMPRYLICEGKEGSAFGGGNIFDLVHCPVYLAHVVAFLRLNPGINDMAWTFDDGRTVVVKRLEKTDEIPQ